MCVERIGWLLATNDSIQYMNLSGVFIFLFEFTSTLITQFQFIHIDNRETVDTIEPLLQGLQKNSSLVSLYFPATKHQGTYTKPFKLFSLTTSFRHLL
jgi:hypothetical protein